MKSGGCITSDKVADFPIGSAILMQPFGEMARVGHKNKREDRDACVRGPFWRDHQSPAWWLKPKAWTSQTARGEAGFHRGKEIRWRAFSRMPVSGGERLTIREKRIARIRDSASLSLLRWRECFWIDLEPKRAQR